jgi:hypothetical protein
MLHVEKTVFISYRRTNMPWAKAISQNLIQHGYDVFLDLTGIASGDFEALCRVPDYAAWASGSRF